MRQGQKKNDAFASIKDFVPVGLENKSNIAQIAKASKLSVDEAQTALISVVRRNEKLLLFTPQGDWFIPASPEEVMLFVEKYGWTQFAQCLNQWMAHRIHMRY